jgi:uncharacterized membrane protein YgcG
MRKPYLVLIILVGLLSAGAIGAAIIVSLQAQSKTDSLAPQVDGGTATCSGGNIDACNRICPSQASRLVIRDTEGHELRITCRRSNVTAKTPVREIPNTKEFIPINPANPNSPNSPSSPNSISPGQQPQAQPQPQRLPRPQKPQDGSTGGSGGAGGSGGTGGSGSTGGGSGGQTASGVSVSTPQLPVLNQPKLCTGLVNANCP